VGADDLGGVSIAGMRPNDILPPSHRVVTADKPSRLMHHRPTCGAQIRMPDHGVAFECGRCGGRFRLPAAARQPERLDRQVARWRLLGLAADATGALEFLIAKLPMRMRCGSEPRGLEPSSISRRHATLIEVRACRP
jgi:ribosomal protein S27AE